MCKGEDNTLSSASTQKAIDDESSMTSIHRRSGRGGKMGEGLVWFAIESKKTD